MPDDNSPQLGGQDHDNVPLIMEAQSPPPIKRKSFIRRQFSDQPTFEQTMFDAVFGILVPIVVLAFDPIVFRQTPGGCLFDGKSLYGTYSLFAYLAIGIGVMAFAGWLIRRNSIRSAWGLGAFI